MFDNCFFHVKLNSSWTSQLSVVFEQKLFNLNCRSKSIIFLIFFFFNKKSSYWTCLSGENASSSNFLDFLFCDLREEASLDDDGLRGQVPLTQNLEESGDCDIDDWRFLLVGCVLFSSLFRDKRPDLVQVDGRAILVDPVGVHVEVPHADLSEVSGMVFVEVDSVMVLTTGVTATSGMLSVFADAAVTVRDVASKLSGLLFVGTYGCKYFI